MGGDRHTLPGADEREIGVDGRWRMICAGALYQKDLCYAWFAAIFLLSIFPLGPLAILPFSLLGEDARRETVQGPQEPESQGLRDYRTPRPV